MDPRAPGVYVREVPSGSRPIGMVGTNTAGFLGIAPDRQAPVGEPVVCNNWTEFQTTFVGAATEGTDLARGVYGFFSNGGGRCYVVNIGRDAPLGLRDGLEAFKALDEIAIVAAPGRIGVDDYEALLGHCEEEGQQDRVAILDAAPGLGRQDIERLTRVITEGPPASGDDRPAAPTKRAEAQPGTASGDDEDLVPAAEPAMNGLRPRTSDDGYGAFYFPQILIRCPVSGIKVAAPPSGHIAGVWARSDATRGVHKAPANEPIVGALGLTYPVSRQEQELLNPAGVNCIRTFPAVGIRVWGARTLAEEASEWRYINVRRLTNMLKESIADGTRWVVFEPNDYTLWRSITRDVGAFLTRVWRDGALLGLTPDEAFYVKCDAETNPEPVRDAGQVVTEIGIAPVKPAEFVIFKLMQSARGVEIEGGGV
jgi:uncharacterized protein